MSSRTTQPRRVSTEMLYQSLRVRIGLRAGDAGGAGNENPLPVGPSYSGWRIYHRGGRGLGRSPATFLQEAPEPAQDLVDLVVGADAAGGQEVGGGAVEISLVEADHALEVAGAL